MKHIGAISGGKDSVAMALLLKEQQPDTNFTWVCTPTGNEPPEWLEHMRKLRDVIGPITPIMYPGGLGALIEGYAQGEAWEAQTGYTFRSYGRDSWPAALKDLRVEFEKGRVPRETRKDTSQCRVCRL